MDALELAVQGRPVAARVARGVRGVMRAYVVRFVPGALRRPELEQARVVMADAPEQPATGPKVLFMTFRAWTSHVAWETTIGQALRLRGARCEYFSCGGGLRICEIGWPAEEDAKPCRFCAPYVAGMIDAARFPRRSLDDLVPEEERRVVDAEVRSASASSGPVVFRGHELDPLVEQSLKSFFRTATLPDTEEVARARDDFRIGAAVMILAASRLIDDVAPDVAVLVNGLFYEDRIVREAALARGVRVVSYEVGAQRGTLFFSDTSPAVDYDITDLWEREGDRSNDESEDRALDRLLEARWSGAAHSRRYYARPRAIRAREGVPLVAVYSNVSWDTAVTGRETGVGSMFDWLTETVRIAQEHPEMDFVVRAHPVESRWRGQESASRERSVDFARRTFAAIPDNIRLVPPEEAVDSYALVDAADVVSVFSSTVGLEAATRGKAVCVAGRPHYASRGFTVDVEDGAHYRALFDDLTWAQQRPDLRIRARRYAYLFFCRSMIPFNAVVEEEPAEPTFAFGSVEELAPGRDAELDLVCDGILGRGPLRRP